MKLCVSSTCSVCVGVGVGRWGGWGRREGREDVTATDGKTREDLMM